MLSVLDGFLSKRNIRRWKVGGFKNDDWDEMEICVF